MGYAVKLQKGGSFIDKILDIYGHQTTYNGYQSLFSFELKENMKLAITQKWYYNGQWQPAAYKMRIADATATTIYMPETTASTATCDLPKKIKFYLATNSFGNAYSRWYHLEFF